MTATADLGQGTVLGRVTGLEEAVVHAHAVLGQPPRGGGHGPLELGEGVVVRSFAVLYEGVRLGAGVQVGHGAVVREDNVVGDGASIGSGADLEPGNRIGARTRIHSGCFLSMATIAEDVFLGPHVVFTDDSHPPCPHYPACARGAVVERGAAIGAGTTVLPGVRIGAGALVGAGSVVVHDVAPGDVVAGAPARRLRRRDELVCPIEGALVASAVGDGSC